MSIFLGSTKIKPSGYSKVYVGNTLVYTAQEPAENEPFYVEAKVDNVNVAFNNIQAGPAASYLSYSTDKVNWTTVNTPYYWSYTIPNTGGRVYIKIKHTQQQSTSNSISCIISDDCHIGGNVMSLCSGNEYKNATAIPFSYSFFGLFSGNSHILSAEDLLLPATTLSVGCYYEMFKNCQSMTIAPKELPANVVCSFCYAYMFSYCYSLIKPVKMYFRSCTSSSDQYICHQMYFSCTSLTTINRLPTLPAILFTYTGMYQGCSNIKVENAGVYQYSWWSPNMEDAAISGIFSNTGGSISSPKQNKQYSIDVEPIPIG